MGLGEALTVGLTVAEAVALGDDVGVSAFFTFGVADGVAEGLTGPGVGV